MIPILLKKGLDLTKCLIPISKSGLKRDKIYHDFKTNWISFATAVAFSPYFSTSLKSNVMELVLLSSAITFSLILEIKRTVPSATKAREVASLSYNPDDNIDCINEIIFSPTPVIVTFVSDASCFIKKQLTLSANVATDRRIFLFGDSEKALAQSTIPSRKGATTVPADSSDDVDLKQFTKKRIDNIGMAILLVFPSTVPFDTKEHLASASGTIFSQTYFRRFAPADAFGCRTTKRAKSKSGKIYSVGHVFKRWTIKSNSWSDIVVE
mmetsp:Transcript_40532/g.48607  ORF Transcript_40532/g.48607 Transcript_40532/m.48607 type:complete len:267 (-) Transcript_40532:1989-2789(-)